MEGRIIQEYFQTDDVSVTPYTNHIGYGCGLGAGDINGNGNAFSYKPLKKNYDGSAIMSFNGHKVYMINGYALYFTHIHKPWACAKIIKNDLTTQDCYVGKINNHVVVAGSIRDALEDLREKIQESGDNDYDIAKAFVYAHPNYTQEYDWDEMVFWHSLSYLSCQSGRQRFSENAHKTKGSTASPKELIEIMKHSRASNIANIMENLYLKKQ